MNRGTIDAQVFLDLLRDAGEAPRSYSGRGMYGRSCIGVVTDDIFALGVSVGQAMAENDLGHIPGAETDSMGCDVIVYWPSLAWPESPEEED